MCALGSSRNVGDPVISTLKSGKDTRGYRSVRAISSGVRNWLEQIQDAKVVPPSD